MKNEDITDTFSEGRLLSYRHPIRTSLIDFREKLLTLIDKEAFNDDEGIAFGCQIFDELKSAINIHWNRSSQQRYYDLFVSIYGDLGSPLESLEGATVVDVGCGSINPFGMLFLFLMLGAKRGIAVDLDEIQDLSKAVKSLADCAAMLLIDPSKLVGDYPIERQQVLANIASFDLAHMARGDYHWGMDKDRLCYLQEPASALPIRDAEADLVVSNSFFEHVQNVDDVIAELARITRKGGYGVHSIDGVDHSSYADPKQHPLEFLKQPNTKEMVGGCNRIRPLDFAPIFEQNGFEVLNISSFAQIELNDAVRSQFVEPYRSMAKENLAVTGARIVVRRIEGKKRLGMIKVGKHNGGQDTRDCLQVALNLIKSNKFTEAIQKLNQSIKLNSKCYQSMVLRGFSKRMLGHFEEADSDLEDAINLKSNRPEAFLHRAWLRFSQERFAEGLLDARQALRFSALNDDLKPELLVVTGLLYSREGSHSEAIETFDKLLELFPESKRVHVHRAWAFKAAGRLQEAKLEAKLALKKDPNDEEAQRLNDLFEKK